MAFIKDIFISYAHIDNESLLEGDKGWISDFQRVLEVRLGQLYGKKPIIWRDQKLTGNDLFDNEIIDQLPQVKLMISIITPRYLKSDWCLKEVDAFHEVSQNNVGFSINNKSRLFKVIKTPVRIDNYPDLIRDQLGYEFFMIDSDTGRAHEFSQIFGEKAQRYYWAKLDDLAHDITYMLEEFDKIIKDPEYIEKSNSNLETNKTIYLAETTQDIKIFRDEVKRELLDFGFTLLPDQSLPLNGIELRDKVTNYIKRADLCIQMFSEKYGVIPEGEQTSVVEIQQELASKHSRDFGLKRILWIPDLSNSSDTRQLEFINKINNEEDELSKAEIVSSNMQDLKSIIQDNFKKQVEEPITDIYVTPNDPKQLMGNNEQIQSMPTEQLPITVYLICIEEDLDSISGLEDFLYEKGYEVTLPVFEGDENLIRQDNFENLKNCDAALLYFGNANDLWIRAKTRELIKIMGYGRKRPLKHKYVYIDEPQTRTKKRFRSQGMHIINGIEGFQEELMLDFTNQLENDR